MSSAAPVARECPATVMTPTLLIRARSSSIRKTPSLRTRYIRSNPMTDRMKVTAERPFGKPEAAARKLLEIVLSGDIDVGQHAYTGTTNTAFLRAGGSVAEYAAGRDLRSHKAGSGSTRLALGLSSNRPARTCDLGGFQMPDEALNDGCQRKSAHRRLSFFLGFQLQDEPLAVPDFNVLVVQQTSGIGYGLGVVAAYHRLEADKCPSAPTK